MRRRPNPARAASAGILAACLVAGCVPYDPGAGTGGGTTTGTALTGTDADVCREACQLLIGCGAALDEGACRDDCLHSNAGLVQCLRQATSACDPLASCMWRAVCSGVAPSGSATCASGETCLISCSGPKDFSCGCGCVGQVAPDVSAELYAVLTCAGAHCSNECGEGGEPVSCESCLEAECDVAGGACN